MPAGLLALDRINGIGPRLRLADGGVRRGLVGEVELVELAAVEVRQSGGECLAGVLAKNPFDGPVLARTEVLDLRFALADQPQRHRLHAAGRAAAGKLAPQHRRQREADEVVERATREIGLDQLAVDFARPGEGIENGAAGDLVEDDALDVDAPERPPLAQNLADVPGDRLALPVRVGGEVEVLGAAHRLGNRLDVLARLSVDLPVHGEVCLGAHRAVLRRKVADVPVRREDGVAVAQVLVDRLRLCRQLDDHHVHQFASASRAIEDTRLPG